MDRRNLLAAMLAAGLIPPGRSGAQVVPGNLVPLRAPAPPRETLAIINGNVWTMDERRPRAQAVLIEQGRVTRIGTSADIRRAAGNARVIDARGNSVLPGFNDSHTHMEFSSYYFSGLQVDVHTPPLKSLEEIFGRLRERVAKTRPGDWVLARGSFNIQQHVVEKRMPTRQELDAISTAHPIIVLGGMHAWSMNTLAFSRLGLFDPAEASNLRWRDGRRRMGSDVARDADGKPTGVVTEMFDLLPENAHSFSEKLEAIRSQVTPLFVAKGITSTSTIPLFDDDMRVCQRLYSEGALPLRTRFYPVIPFKIGLDEVLHGGLMSGFGDEMLTFGGVKLFVAGAGYDAAFERVTDMHWAQEDLEDAVMRAHEAGLHMMLHQAGTSLKNCLQALEKAQKRSPRPLRHRLEHYGTLTDEEIVRVKQLGMRVAITAPVGPASGRSSSRFPRYRAMIDGGLRPVSISDSTGTVPTFSPLAGIAGLVASQGDGGSAPEGQAPTLEEAVRMWTLWAAESVHEEDTRGSLTPGKFGDVVVLDQNIERVRGRDLFGVGVQATVLGGKVVHGG
ncbi:amidohydrolase [Phenylobacterium sp.]|jgi:predicted amidohydrolase YtcJ|uniref:amidohydrolase n=1 Tax=Phenylobacterium sp. TaxID=1871053 RepID=UPI0037842B76